MNTAPWEDLNARRQSFLSDAEDYDRYRPGYPPEAVAWVIGREQSTVIDIGCGPGNLTAQLMELGHFAIGVDPSTVMLQRASAKGLRVAGGSAEALPLRDACCDVVSAATSFHWFDQARAVPEMRRVLRPGGRVGLFTNIRDEQIDWVKELSEIIGSEEAMFVTLGGADGMETEWLTKLEGAGLFGSTEHRIFDLEQALTEEHLVGLVRSRSYIAILPDDERVRILNEVVRLCREHPDLAGRAEFSLPYKTHAFRAMAA